jgi:hypothetical protein
MRRPTARIFAIGRTAMHKSKPPGAPGCEIARIALRSTAAMATTPMSQAMERGFISTSASKSSMSADTPSSSKVAGKTTAVWWEPPEPESSRQAPASFPFHAAIAFVSLKPGCNHRRVGLRLNAIDPTADRLFLGRGLLSLGLA